MEAKAIKKAAGMLKEDLRDLDDLDYHYDMVLEAIEDHLDFLKSKHPSASPDPYECVAAIEMLEVKLDHAKAYYAPTKVAINAAIDTRPGAIPHGPSLGYTF